VSGHDVKRALACADGVVRWPGQSGLTFVPDQFMDDPEQTKAGLRDAYRHLLDLDFELLLLAHGEPIVARGKEALLAFAHARPGERSRVEQRVAAVSEASVAFPANGASAGMPPLCDPCLSSRRSACLRDRR
jgi:hypothetical protein